MYMHVISIHLDVKEDGDDHEEHAEGPAEVEGGHADGVRLFGLVDCVVCFGVVV